MACATARIDDAKKAAAAANATVLIVGADQSIEAEIRDRADLLLPRQQQLLITEVAKASRGPLILVIMSGSGFGTSSAKDDDKVSSILWVGYPGEAGEAAISSQRFDEEKPISILDEILMIIQDDIDCYPHLSKGCNNLGPRGLIGIPDLLAWPAGSSSSSKSASLAQEVNQGEKMTGEVIGGVAAAEEGHHLEASILGPGCS
ncbi:hypothetical protein Nepgr_004209 [Nepenthes gracilis]|uniref:Glycoside hydrolase family 3 C-terminal domain-containing protein n=1 Tax=Nepenthes gracilis TaxID=150966 RepID=A0AAD3XEY0_NEPGR|nr:hypothetical protein Nepgr_004209 [Nepenthes gracilis]